MTARTCTLTTLGLALLLAAPAAHGACPTITRDKIISIAKSGVGCRYVWGGTCWNPSNKKWKGADCSGYVTVCWQIPKASKTTSCLPHYYTTSSYKYSSTHWSSISRNSLLKGDALNYNSGGGGHIVLFSSGDKWGNAKVYEARGSAYGILYRTKYVSSSYAGRRRHRIVSPTPAKPKYPLMTIGSSISTIGKQARDFCTTGKSKNIFDWKVGQTAHAHVDVKNSGTAVAKNVYVAIWAEQPYLKVAQWNIYTNWKSSGYVLNDTDGLQKLSHSSPPKQFKLWLAAISPGETKRIKLKLQASKFSVGAADHPDLRAWVFHVDSYYEKKDFSSSYNNVKGYQKQNGGNLRVYYQTDIFSNEVCDKKDNDCDGQVDEGAVCGKPPVTQKDSGTPSATKQDGALPSTPDSDPPANPESDAGHSDAWTGTMWDTGTPPPQQPPAATSGDIDGGCQLATDSHPAGNGMLLLLLLALATQVLSRGRVAARRGRPDRGQ